MTISGALWFLSGAVFVAVWVPSIRELLAARDSRGISLGGLYAMIAGDVMVMAACAIEHLAGPFCVQAVHLLLGTAYAVLVRRYKPTGPSSREIP